MLHIIINPSSSSGNGLKQWEKLEQLFLEAGAEYAVHLTGPDNRIEKICEELTSRGEETTIVLLGGDGSMNAAVNGIRDFASTKIGFIPVRKPNKLPRKTISYKYDLEYGSNELHMHADSVKPGQKVLIIDDLLATGGTVEATIRMVEQMGGEVVGCAFLIELEDLGGRERLKDYNVFTLLKY